MGHSWQPVEPVRLPNIPAIQSAHDVSGDIRIPVESDVRVEV